MKLKASQTHIKFTNNHHSQVDIYFNNIASGQHVRYRKLKAGQVYTQPTIVGNQWILKEAKSETVITTVTAVPWGRHFKIPIVYSHEEKSENIVQSKPVLLDMNRYVHK